MTQTFGSNLARGDLTSAIGALRDSSSPDVFVPTLGHKDCLERLSANLTPGTVSIVTGDTGLGKTLLGSVLRQQLNFPHLTISMPPDARIHTDVQLLRHLLERMDVPPQGRSGLDLLSEVQAVLDRRSASEGRVVLIIDDAHRLSSSQLDVLRTLLDVAFRGETLVVILFGEPELSERLHRKRRLDQFVAVRHVLNPVNQLDAERILDTRLHCINHRAHELFNAAALKSLYQFSTGNPAKLLTIARTAIDSPWQSRSGDRIIPVDHRAIRDAASISTGGDGQPQLLTSLDASTRWEGR